MLRFSPFWVRFGDFFNEKHKKCGLNRYHSFPEYRKQKFYVPNCFIHLKSLEVVSNACQHCLMPKHSFTAPTCLTAPCNDYCKSNGFKRGFCRGQKCICDRKRPASWNTLTDKWNRFGMQIKCTQNWNIVTFTVFPFNFPVLFCFFKKLSWKIISC